MEPFIFCGWGPPGTSIYSLSRTRYNGSTKLVLVNWEETKKYGGWKEEQHGAWNAETGWTVALKDVLNGDVRAEGRDN